MSATSSQRPPLDSQDTFDAPLLSGKIGEDGVAHLQASSTPTATIPSISDGNAVLSDHSPASKDDNSSDEAVTDEDIEDYDSITIDPDTIIHGSRGGALDYRRASSGDNLKPPQPSGFIRRESDPGNDQRDGDARRHSVQVRLQKTGKKGRYILTADDPEIREILSRGIEREEAAARDAQRSRTRIRDLVFTRQFTTFDRQNPLSSESPFHGFFTLFWLAMVLMFVKVSAGNWRTYGSILGRNEIMELMFQRDVLVLGVTDVAMLSSTLFGFVLQHIIIRGYLSWNKSGWIIQNVWQSVFLASVIGWTYYRDWPWTHTIFIILHTIVFLMKQHSYAFYNGYLAGVYRRRSLLQRKLRQLREMEPVESHNSSPIVSKSSAVDFANGASSSTHNLAKRPSIGIRTSTNLSKETSDVANVASAMESGQSLDSDQMQAFERVIQSEIESLNTELKGKCVSGDNSYPKNLTLTNFIEWSCLPTLVYELEYPRQDHINWWYVAEKTAATFGTIGVMMVISQAYIYPPVAETVRMKEAGMSLQERAFELPWIVGDMLFPLLLEQLLSWYVIWVSNRWSLDPYASTNRS